MDKATQIFILKQKVIELLVNMLQEKETPIEYKTILEFANILNNFFIK